MGEFFRGWRRKIGMVTLLMACVVMGGWLRSPHHCDSFNSRIGKLAIIWLISADVQIGVSIITSEDSVIAPKSAGWITYMPETFEALFPRQLGFVWRCRYCGFGKSINQSGDVFVWVCPYWSIVIPLMLLSAYLLLTKPRKSTSVKVTEPITVEGK